MKTKSIILPVLLLVGTPLCAQVTLDIDAAKKDIAVSPTLNGIFFEDINHDADNELQFHVSGTGVYQAACNGDATSIEPFTGSQMKAFHGELVMIVRSTKQAGDIKISIKDLKNKHLSNEIIVKSIK